MQIAEKVVRRARELMESGEVCRVLGWEAGEDRHGWTPALFTSPKEAENLVYGEYAGANLSKIAVGLPRAEGKTLILLKPCDALSFNQLIHEHRLDREDFYIIGAGCAGMRDENGPLTKCITCKGKGFESVNEVIDDDECRALSPSDRFAEVERLENMTAEERFAFWRGELSRCIRCNACRNVCPACTCRACVFDDPKSGVASKSNVTDFEENLYHIIRAFHVAGRCTDCGECSRVCPQRIPLHLINRKLIKDMNALYGEYQAGTGTDERTPLTRYAAGDAEPSVVLERGNA